MNIYDLLNQVSQTMFQQNIRFEKPIRINSPGSGFFIEPLSGTKITITDILNSKDLDEIRDKNKYPVKCLIVEIQVQLYKEDCKPHKICKNPSECWIENLEDLNRFSAFVKTQKITRDWLTQDKLSAYIVFNHRSHKIPSNIWLTDQNWYRLLADGHLHEDIPSISSNQIGGRLQGQSNIQGVVDFKKIDLDRLLENKSLTRRNKNDQDEETLMPISDQKRRAALRLLEIALKNQDSYQVEFRGEIISFAQFIKNSKKAALKDELSKLGKDNGISIIKRIQSALSKKTQDALERLDENSVSQADLESIATLLRNISQQAGQPKNNHTKHGRF